MIRSVLPTCMSVSNIVWCPWRPEEGIRSPVTGVTGSCESPEVGAGNCIWSSGKAVSNLSSPNSTLITEMSLLLDLWIKPWKDSAEVQWYFSSNYGAFLNCFILFVSLFLKQGARSHYIALASLKLPV